MDGEIFAYDGKSGRWTYTIYLVKSEDGAFGGSAEITLHALQRCKLAVNLPNTTQAAGVAILKKKCIAWIDEFEKGGVASVSSGPFGVL